MSAFADTRLDPYKNFKFLLMSEGRYLYGGNLPNGATPVIFRPGGDPSFFKTPGRNKYEPITLQRGVAYDQAFNNWANQVSKFAGNTGSQAPPANFRKDLYLVIYNEAGHWVTSYQMSHCWVSGYKALPDFSSNSNAIAIQHIQIEHEGLILSHVHR
jgi:phage tail-like protein